MNKLLLALGAASLALTATPAVAEHHHGWQHQGQPYNHYQYQGYRHHHDGFRIIINPYGFYNYPYYPYTQSYRTWGYYGPIWRNYDGTFGCRTYSGREGILVDRWGRIIRFYMDIDRDRVRCA